MKLPEGKYYFVSDVHLGEADDVQNVREQRFVEFLRSLPADTTGLFLLGDIFDFWVEYKHVVPRGYVRVLGELARLADSGVEIWFFRGNHDYWVTDYLKNEIGVHVVDETYKVMEIGGRTLCLGHGDGIGPRPLPARIIFHFFRSPFWISLLRAVHPWFIFRFARRWSSSSRHSHSGYDFRGADEPIYKFAEEMASKRHIDTFIFGHLHCGAATKLPGGENLYLLDDWGKGPNYLNLLGMYISGLGLPNMEK